MVAPRKTLAAQVASIAALGASKLVQARPSPYATPKVSKIGIPPGPVASRNVAQVDQPSADTGKGALRQSATTYFTKAATAGASELYSADRLWAKVTVTLETAGPVAVGFVSDLGPVASGKGTLLDPNEPVVFNVAKGSKLYIQATGVNRVKLQIESYPWMEQITGALVGIMKLVKAAMGVS